MEKDRACLVGGLRLGFSTAVPKRQVPSLPKHECNLLCFSLAEEEIKTEQEVVEGMDISTRSKGE